jgi:geranylgeranyl diphosphate synthase type II
VENRIKLIDTFLKNSIKDRFYELNKAVEYSLFTGGKRLRPLISILISEILGIKNKDILPFAAAIEYLHTASLIHDDLPIMDNDDIRRGKPAVHKKFSDQIALLAGDIMVSEAMKFIINHDYDDNIKNELLSLLSKTWGNEGISGGQSLEIEKKRVRAINPLRIFKMKTGALFGAAFLGPAIIKDLDCRQQRKLYSIGVNIGMIFQINDDIADIKDKSYNITNEIDYGFLMEYKQKMIDSVKNMMEKDNIINNDLKMILIKIFREE